MDRPYVVFGARRVVLDRIVVPVEAPITAGSRPSSETIESEDAGIVAIDAQGPDYGMYGGSGWGTGVWGEAPALRVNQGDVASLAHDKSGNEFEWIARNFTTRPDLQWVGPAGAAYALVGAPVFAMSGLVSGDRTP